MAARQARVDMHMHVGVLGQDRNARLGRISPEMQHDLPYKIFLMYARLSATGLTDAKLRQAAIDAISSSGLHRVVCLALDPVYTEAGVRDEAASNMWVANEYIAQLRNELPDRILYGASVHPYDPNFEQRVGEVVADGAVLIKWLPSAQQINLADARVRKALQFLAAAGKNGEPLPALIHVGTEAAIMSTDPRTMSYDFLTWGKTDRFWNALRPAAKRWNTPDLKGVHSSLRAGLDAGACVIFAHCGLPYFAPSILRKLVEHSDFDAVAQYLHDYPGQQGTIKGKAFADVSACVTPFRKSYFEAIRDLPPGAVLVGSDFPVPIFELSSDLAEHARDLKAIMSGHLDRVVIPQDNLLDVNWRELEHAFPGHAMFTNAAQMPGWT